MSAAILGRKSGKSGAGSGSSASEAPNTLQSTATARLVEIISHGECVGLANADHPLRSVFFDGVAAQNEDGSNNFTGLTIQQRTGLPVQDPFEGFSETESETGIGLQITTANPRTYVVTNNNVSAVRVRIQFDALSEQDTTNGGIKGSSVTFKIQRRVSGGSWEDVLEETISDKCTSPQQISYRVARPAAATTTTDWEVKVIRISADSTTVTIQNSITLNAVTEIVESNLQYASLAGVALAIDSKQFGSSIPTRSYDWVGMILDVPSNYTPANYLDPNDLTKRTYTGLWDGTFKRAWTDNPAWILWAMLTDKEWGLGRVIDPAQVDKWSLYQIAQYCDEFVDDGYGGKEPRYTINTQITSSEEAYAMLQSIASTFRGMLYWGPGSVTFVADQPKDPVKLVSQANVIGGEFIYSGASLKARHSVARVTWNDPTDQYRAAIEVVEDADMLDRFGYRTTDVVAYGCTSRGQANRMGRWILDTEKYESELVSYEASFDHADVRPGDIIQVHDPYYAGARYGGRITAVTNTSVSFDAPVLIESGQTYSVTLVRPDGALITRTITNSPGSTSTLTWSSSIAQLPNTGTSAIIFSEASENSTQRATVMASSTTSVTLREEITLLAGVEYELTHTKADGSFESKVLTITLSDTTTKSISLPSALSVAPELYSVIHICPVGEGYQARAIGSRTATSCGLSASITLKPGLDYSVLLTLPDSTVITRKLTNSAGSTSTITWTDAVNELPAVGSLWGLTSTNVSPRQFRVLGLQETSRNVFGVTALAYDPNKYARVEEGLALPPKTSSVYASEFVPLPPTNLQGYRRPVLQGDGSFTENIVIFWTPSTSSYVNRYRVSYKYSNGPWVSLGEVTSPTAEFRSQGTGDYTFSVIAVNFSGKESTPLLVTLTVSSARPLAESTISNIRVEGTADVAQPSQVQFEGRDLTVTWNLLPPADWVNPDPEHWDDPYFRRYRIRIKNASHSILKTYYTTENRFFFGFDQNVEAGGGTPSRDFYIGVSLEDTTGNVYDEVEQRFYNPPPELISVTVNEGETELSFQFDEPNVSDYAGIIVWLAQTTPVALTEENKVWQGRGLPVIPVQRDTAYYFRYALYDTFGTSGLNVSLSQLATSKPLLIDGHPSSWWVDQIVGISTEGADLLVRVNELALASLETSMRNVEDRGYLEDLVYDAGEPIKTILQTEITNRIDGDTALLEVMNLIGAVSIAGDAFILDVDSVKISPTESLATRFALIETNFGDVEASIATESSTRSTADTALANTISKIGALNGGGTAFIFDTSTAFVSPTESLATRLSSITSSLNANSAAITSETSARTTADSALSSSITTLSATVAGHTSSITTLQSVDSAFGAKWGVSLNVNGHITGVILNNNGASGNAVFVVDNFAVVNSSGSTSVVPFLISGGTVYMDNVVARNIGAGTITADKVVANNITETSLSSDNSSVTLTYGSEITIGTISVYVPTGKVVINTKVNIGNSGNLSSASIKIYRDGVLLDSYGQLCDVSWGDNNTAWEVTDSPGGGWHTYTVTATRTSTNGGPLTKSRCNIRAEVRKTES